MYILNIKYSTGSHFCLNVVYPEFGKLLLKSNTVEHRFLNILRSRVMFENQN